MQIDALVRDAASYCNIDMRDAWQVIAAGLRGEAAALRTLCVHLPPDQVTGETEADRVRSRYVLIRSQISALTGG